jgi:hypothetical protein
VAGDAGQHAFLAYHVNHSGNLAKSLLGKQEIHDAAMNVTGYCTHRGCAVDAGFVLADLWASLGEPLKLAALIPVFEQEPHDVVVGARDPRVDAERFRLAQGLLDSGGRIVTLHQHIHGGALM